MSDDDKTPAWLQRLMDEDRAGVERPLDEVTERRMINYLRESGRRESEREARLLSLLWTRWGLVQHPLSRHALKVGRGSSRGNDPLSRVGT